MLFYYQNEKVLQEEEGKVNKLKEDLQQSEKQHQEREVLLKEANSEFCALPMTLFCQIVIKQGNFYAKLVSAIF